MRLIGHLENEGLADRLSRALLAQGIHNLVEPDDGPRWAIWVHAEEDLDRARQLLNAFRANPEDPAYHVASRPAGASGERAAQSGAGSEERAPRRRARPVPVPVPVSGGAPILTFFFILACIAVAYATRLGDSAPLVRDLQISEVFFRWGRSWELFLPEVRRGEVWRLFTPALLHFGLPHIVFNLWILWDLGQMIEQRRGTLHLLALTVALGVVSNLGQYLVAGPRFGGFSGIVYGLLGYAWMMGRYRPDVGVGLHPQTVVMMLVWFVICLSGALGIPVANTAHGVGLAGGMIWGRLEALKRGP